MQDWERKRPKGERRKRRKRDRMERGNWRDYGRKWEVYRLLWKGMREKKRQYCDQGKDFYRG